MLGPPQVSTSYETLSASNPARREELLEVFGQHLFWMRNERLAAILNLLHDADSRARLGTTQRRAYESVAALGEQGIAASTELVQATLDQYIQLVLALLSNTGADLRFGPAHSLRYRMILEVINSETLDVIEEAVINRGTERSLPVYFGRWLNRFSEPKPNPRK